MFTSLSLPESVTIVSGEGGLPVVRVASAAATGEVYLNGAHVTAWTPTGADPVIWMSGSSNFIEGRAIRGGIPICFPWFGPGREPGMAPAHGFGRLAQWRLTGAREDEAGVTVVFSLTEADVAGLPGVEHFPHAFTATYTVEFGHELKVCLRVENTGAEPFSYEEALHTYFAVPDVRSTGVFGLAGAHYVDKVDGGVVKEQAGDIAFTGETDRIYFSAGNTVIREANRAVQVNKVNSLNTVVWNPWGDKAAAMADFGDDEWPGMVCVESANVGDDAVVLAPGAHHEMHVKYALTV